MGFFFRPSLHWAAYLISSTLAFHRQNKYMFNYCLSTPQSSLAGLHAHTPHRAALLLLLLLLDFFFGFG